VYDAKLAAISPDPTIVRPPAPAGYSYVDVTNTGRTTWDPASIHLTVAGAPGSADPLTGLDRTPGDFVKNLTTGDGSPVQHDQMARIEVNWNVMRLVVGSYADS
jgi:hypothetical protein